MIRASEGNPLFLEEMVHADARGRRREVLSTIQALLAARLERLGVAEREVLERGAVEGELPSPGGESHGRPTTRG